MKNRKIRSLAVSPIGMGCMGFSHGYGKVPEEKEVLHPFVKLTNLAVHFLIQQRLMEKKCFIPDIMRELVGKALSPFRNKVVLATKYHLDEKEVNESTTLYTAIRNHLIASMEKLRTDYVDLYYLHRINEQLSLEEIAEVMGRLIKEGMIREWGLSQVSVETLAKAHGITPVGAVQNLYSMVERDCEREIFPYCLENEIAVVPFSPIASGFLSGKSHTRYTFLKEMMFANSSLSWLKKTS